MKNFLKYLSTAPVLMTLWLSTTALLLMLINFYFPNGITFEVL